MTTQRKKPTKAPAAMPVDVPSAAPVTASAAPPNPDVTRASAARPSTEDPQSRKVAARWTAKLVAGGWTVVPDFFLAHYSRLIPPITNAEAMLVIQLIRFKWDERPPRPSYRTLSKSMGMTDTAVRGHARRLEIKGYLKRRKRTGAPNWFYLEPLFEKLEALMPIVEAEIQAEREAEFESEKWSGSNAKDAE